jgi:hypothetical protein
MAFNLYLPGQNLNPFPKRMRLIPQHIPRFCKIEPRARRPAGGLREC